MSGLERSFVLGGIVAGSGYRRLWFLVLKLEVMRDGTPALTLHCAAICELRAAGRASVLLTVMRISHF